MKKILLLSGASATIGAGILWLPRIPSKAALSTGAPSSVRSFNPVLTDRPDTPANTGQSLPAPILNGRSLKTASPPSAPLPPLFSQSSATPASSSTPPDAGARAASPAGAPVSPEADGIPAPGRDAASPRSPEDAIASLLSRPHDLSDPATRADLVRRVKALETAQILATEVEARRRGLAVSGTRGNGRLFRLTGFHAGRPVYVQTENVNAAITTAAHLVRSTAPFLVDGTGQTAGIWEVEGIPLPDHREFAGPVTPRINVIDKFTPVSAHATHVAGTMIAAGVSASVKGMAPAARLDAYDTSNDVSEMLNAGAASAEETGKLQISVHSYGFGAGWEYDGDDWIWYGTFDPEADRADNVDSRFGQYNNRSASWDSVMYSLPYYQPFTSAGNHGTDGPDRGDYWYYDDVRRTYSTSSTSTHPRGDGDYKGGYDTLEGTKLAKNVIAVGSVADAETGGARNTADAKLSSFSSTGPADDGRIKPDLVANGAGVLSTSDATTRATERLDGTSMAAPNAAGSALLLTEYYGKRFPGARMRASTLKALLLHTADDLGQPGPDYLYGWGLMNTLAAAQLIQRFADGTGNGTLIEDKVSSTATGSTHRFTSTGTLPLRLTLCWTDPAGGVKYGHDDREKALVNDLNLRVTGPDGTELLPYVMPHVGSWTQASLASPATYGVNHVDNVEQVYRPGNAAAGTYTVTVNYTGLLTNDVQNYSLAVSGLNAVPALSGLEAWRETHFGSPGGTGNAADNFDADRDGLPNLVEFAFGLNPLDPASSQLPPPSVEDGQLRVSFPTPAGVSGIVYRAEWTTDPAVDTWAPLADSGTSGQHTFSLPMHDGPRKFMRFRIQKQ